MNVFVLEVERRVTAKLERAEEAGVTRCSGRGSVGERRAVAGEVVELGRLRGEACWAACVARQQRAWRGVGNDVHFSEGDCQDIGQSYGSTCLSDEKASPLPKDQSSGRGYVKSFARGK